MTRYHALFSGRDCRDEVKERSIALANELQGIFAAQPAEVSADELYKQLASKHRIDIPKIRSDEKRPVVTTAHLSANDYGHQTFTSSGTIPGFHILYHVPFDGDHTWFECRGNRFSTSMPRAEVFPHELVFHYKILAQDQDKVEDMLARDLRDVESYLNDLQLICDGFNTSIEPTVRELVASRNQHVSAANALASKLPGGKRK